MPAKKPQPSSEESSSDDEEERARMAAIQSVAIESSAVVQSAATSKSKAQARRKGARAEADGSDASEDEQNGGLKHYQLKVWVNCWHRDFHVQLRIDCICHCLSNTRE